MASSCGGIWRLWVMFVTTLPICWDVSCSLPTVATTVESGADVGSMPLLGIRYVTMERPTRPRSAPKMMRTALSRLRNRSNIAGKSPAELKTQLYRDGGGECRRGILAGYSERDRERYTALSRDWPAGFRGDDQYPDRGTSTQRDRLPVLPASIPDSRIWNPI